MRDDDNVWTWTIRGLPIAPEHPTKKRLAELRRMPYVEYLRTDEWRHRRRQAIQAAEYRCSRCGAIEETGLHVHHRTYERLGCEHPYDLEVLCADCHADEHGLR